MCWPSHTQSPKDARAFGRRAPQLLPALNMCGCCRVHSAHLSHGSRSSPLRPGPGSSERAASARSWQQVHFIGVVSETHLLGCAFSWKSVKNRAPCLAQQGPEALSLLMTVTTWVAYKGPAGCGSRMMPRPGVVFSSLHLQLSSLPFSSALKFMTWICVRTMALDIYKAAAPSCGANTRSSSYNRVLVAFCQEEKGGLASPETDLD